MWGGGSKVFAEKAPSNGETHVCHIQPWWNGKAFGCRILGRRLESWSLDASGGATAILAAPGLNLFCWNFILLNFFLYWDFFIFGKAGGQPPTAGGGWPNFCP